MKKGIILFITFMIFAASTFAYRPTPKPPLDPATVPFVYNVQATPLPIAWAMTEAGTKISADQIIYDEHRDDVTLTIELPNGTLIIATQVSVTDDPNDPDGNPATPPDDNIIGLRYVFHWEWNTTLLDEGLQHLKMKAMDSDGLSTTAGFLALITKNRPPVFGGCTIN